ncbi:hypothetical protein [Aquimarina aggregata]|uniref:hypothetical protein n=1 Tax=Aquimarina aggregata TaxID=1642818 RepID=UPI0024902056|nr:hypothetical protein [Aquimarina aggregata]
MNIFDFNNKLPENPIVDVLRKLEGKTVEYSEGIRTTIMRVHNNGNFECDPLIIDQDTFAKYINDYLNNYIKFK